MMHAFTGCDTVSYFKGIEKTTMWNVWNNLDEMTNAFHYVLDQDTVDNDEFMGVIERFVILLYSRTSDQTSINIARKRMFTQGRHIDAISPTRDALIQHTKRSIYQGGLKMKKTTCGNLYGQLFQEASKSCQELLRCGCKQRCP